MISRQEITQISNISHAISNPRQGDWVFFDIDETLLKTGLSKYDSHAKLTEANLAANIMFLRQVGVKVVGLTARINSSQSKTIEQLKAAGIEMDEIIHAPNVHHDDGSKTPTKGKAARAHVLGQAELGKTPKRIFAFDDVLMNLEDIQSELHDLGIPFYGKHYVPVQHQPIHINDETNNIFPDNLNDYEVVKPLGGGSQSVYEIKHRVSGNRLVIKFGSHEDSAKLEILSNAAYQAMGVAVPKMRVYHTLPDGLAEKLGLTQPFGMFKVCEYIDGNTDKNREAVIKESAARNFVAHALLGNIDVAKPDNFIVDQSGKAHLIDAGANFIFRSRGKLRDEHPELASEIDSLRNDAINHTGAAWFGAINDDEIARQLGIILTRIRELEEAVWHVSNELELGADLREKFIAALSERLDVLTTKYAGVAQAHAKSDKKAHVDHTAAGILTYTMIDNVPHILLSKRVRHEWWDNFGGKSDAADIYLLDTARREVREESNGLLDYSEYALAESPCHDIVTGKRERQHVYRMYIAEHAVIDPQKFNDHEHTAHQWVPVSDVLKAVKSEGEKVIHTENGDIPLFPPLCRMLEQGPVLEQLEMLSAARQLKRRCTLSYDEKQNTEANDTYRPIVTMHKKRQDLAVHTLKKTKTLKQLKHKRERKSEDDKNPAEVKKGKADNGLSPSELHMASVLGSQYIANDVLANVTLMVENHFSQSIPADRKQDMIHAFVNLIEHEKENSHQFHFYHGCNHEISFAYDVYSALYKEIYANDAWRAFRIDTPQFKRFKNIIEFIDHYSKGGTETIDNNDEDYHEYAICTNVFLFGNHETATSCSVRYMLDNTVMRGVKMEEMLEQLFRPYNVSREWMSRLIELFNNYAKLRQGTLYQLSMSKDHAQGMSYPAGFLGVLKKLNDDIDITSVLDTLLKHSQDKNLTAQHAKYIQKLQARLLASPAIEMDVKQIHVSGLSQKHDAEFRDALHGLMSELVYQTHLHAEQAHPARERGIYRTYPHVLRQNQLSYQAGVSDETLAAMVKSNDADRLREVIANDPAILKRRISLHKNNYMKNHVDRHQHEAPSLLDLILIESTMLARQLGPEFEKMALNTMQSSRVSLIKVMKKISIENRLPYLMKHLNGNYVGVMSDPNHVFEYDIKDLVKILKLLPEKERVIIYQRYEDVFLPFKYAAVMHVFELLPDDVRLAFYNKIRSNISKAKQLHIAIGILPQHERLSALAAYEHLLKPIKWKNYKVIYAYFDIIGLLPVEARLDFAIRHQELIGDSDALLRVLNRMDPESCSKFLAQYCGKISSVDIVAIITCLPASERYAFALKHEQEMSEWSPTPRWIQVLKLLPEHNWYDFVKHFEKKLNAEDMADVLKLLPQPYHLEILKNRYHTCVRANRFENREDILVIVNNLPASSKQEYLAFILDNIADSYVDDSIHESDKLTQGMRLAFALKFMPKAERMPLVRKYEHAIKARKELLLVAKSLNADQLNGLINRHLDVIKNGADLYHVAEKLPDHLRFMFMLPLISRINEMKGQSQDNEYDCRIKRILDLLYDTEQKQLLLREYLKYPIHGMLNLFDVLAALPADEHYTVLMKNLNAAAGYWFLPDLLKYVPGDKKMDFTRAFAAITTKTSCLYDLLKNIPIKERAEILINRKNPIEFKHYGKHHENLSTYVNLLPECDQRRFLVSLIPATAEMLSAMMEFLPSNDILYFAKQYGNLFVCVFELGSILQKFNSDQEREILVTQLSQSLFNESIKTNCLRDISFVIKYLPENDRCKYLNKFSHFITSYEGRWDNTSKKYVSVIKDSLPEADQPVLENLLRKTSYYTPEPESRPSKHGLFQDRSERQRYDDDHHFDGISYMFSM